MQEARQRKKQPKALEAEAVRDRERRETATAAAEKLGTAAPAASTEAASTASDVKETPSES